jgi:branched-chain amino acid transport system permease protein
VGGFPIPPFSIPGVLSVEMSYPTNFFYFAVALTGMCVWLLWHFTKTPLGTVMVAIRDNPNRVEYLGFKVPHTKAIVFLVSGGFAGVAGAVYALFQNLVSTDGALSAYTSFVPIMMSYIGGIGSFFGPLYGSAIMAILDELITRFTERVELVTGSVFILVVMFAPMGLAGVIRAMGQRRPRREKRMEAAS